MLLMGKNGDETKTMWGRIENEMKMFYWEREESDWCETEWKQDIDERKQRWDMNCMEMIKKGNKLHNGQ